MIHWPESLSIFGSLLDMSLTGSVIILFVLLARLCLKRAPKVYSYILWAAVLFRLLCPAAVTAPVSALNVVRPEVTGGENTVSLTMYVANTPAVSRSFANIPVNGTRTEDPPEKHPAAASILTAVWTAGFLIMSAHGLAGFFLLRKKLTGAVKIRANVYLADGIDTPFVLGILRPGIYLPSGIPAAQRPLILAHERRHIRRLDMLWKLLGYLALCLHWFNPLVWLAFVLAEKDMEMSCDEAVLCKMDKAYHADYAAALLQLSAGRRIIAGMPLAFGEGDTKGRIRNMAKWKAPKVWVSILCFLLCAAAAAAFLTDPVKDEQKGSGKYELIIGEKQVYTIRITSPNGEETFSHADHKPYESGEKISLGTMSGADSFAGVTVEAFGEDGMLIWACSIPEELGKVSLLHDGPWYLMQTVTKNEELAQLTVGPCSIGIGKMNFELPYSVVMRTTDSSSLSGTVHSILAENKCIGGIRLFPMESEPEHGEFDWMYELDLPEWDMENVGYFVDSIQRGAYSAEIFQDVPPGTERTVHNEHRFYYCDGYMYDLWFDKLNADSLLIDQILDSVQIGTELSGDDIQSTLTGSPSGDWLGLEISAFYDFGPLPGDFHVETGGDVRIMQGTEHVGTITAYPIPLNAYDPEDPHFSWLERSGISDFGISGLFYEGGMSFSYNRWMARFTGDDPKSDRYHFFQISGNYIFDICFDGLLVDYDTQQALLAAIRLKAPGLLPDAEHTIHSQSDEEETAYQTVSAFLNALRASPTAYIVLERTPIGTKAPNARSGYYYLADGDLYYNATEKQFDGSMRETAIVQVGGKQYTGTSAVFGDDLVWTETRDDISHPWMYGIDWNRQTFQYIGATADSAGTTYLYHSDLWYEEDQGGYFVSFRFNSDGQFDHVTLRVNQFLDNDYEVTEMLFRTDPAAGREWIDREYQKAIG